MSSTGPPHRNTPYHSVNLLGQENSPGNASPEAGSVSLPGEDEQNDVFPAGEATPGSAIDSTHVDTETEGHRFAAPLSSSVVEDDDNLTPTPGNEELSPLNITPIRSPNPDDRPDLNSENYQTTVLPEPYKEPHLPSISHTARQPDIAREGNDARRAYLGSKIGGSVPLPGTLVHPHNDSITPVPSPADLYPAFLRELSQPITPVPSSFLSSAGAASHTTPSTTLSPSDQGQQGPPTTGLIVTEPVRDTEPPEPQITRLSWTETAQKLPQLENPESSRSREAQQYPGTHLLRIPASKPQRRKNMRHTLGSESQRQVRTQYVNMLLAMEDIPKIYNIMAEFFTWILLAGFVLLPGSFPSLQKLGVTGTAVGSVDQRTLHATAHLSLFVVAWVCTGTGILGMLWLTWRWHKNYIWVLKKIYFPGFKSAFAGFISILTNIYAVQGSQLGTTSEVTLIVVVATTGICYILTVFYSFWLIGSVKNKHDWQVGVQGAGKYREGMVDPPKRKTKAQAEAVELHDQTDLRQEFNEDEETIRKVGLVDILG